MDFNFNFLFTRGETTAGNLAVVLVLVEEVAVAVEEEMIVVTEIGEVDLDQTLTDKVAEVTAGEEVAIDLSVAK